MRAFTGHLAVFGAVCLWAWGGDGGLVPVVTAPAPQSFLYTASDILGHNLRALVVLLFGSVATAGLFGLALFATNGYAFGLYLRALPAAVVPWTWLYAPLEVAAFACGATAAMRVFWSGMRTVLHGAPMPWRPVTTLLLVSVLGLTVAALLETLAIRYGWRFNAQSL